MNEEKLDIILKGIRWLVQRDSMKPEFRETFDDSIIDKIDGALKPEESNTESKIKESLTLNKEAKKK